MRSNQASPGPEPQPAASAAPARTGGGRASRKRVAALAAGGVVLAQLWGLGIGVAHAAARGAGAPVGRSVRSIGDPAAPGADALPDVDGLLRDRIRGGGLPLPGQVTAVPDAFAIAAGLLPAAAGQSGAPRDPVRGAAPGAPGAQSPDRTDPSAARTGPRADGAGTHQGSARAEEVGRTGPGSTRVVPVSGGGEADGEAGPHGPEAASRDAERPLVGGTRPVDGGPALLAPPADGTGGASAGLGRPVAAAQDAPSFPAGGVQGAVLIPIAAGLLLTGAAMYKHRGLPKGH